LADLKLEALAHSTKLFFFGGTASLVPILCRWQSTICLGD
jgi:hypothetical protein